jgi:hypothetical protein
VTVVRCANVSDSQYLEIRSRRDNLLSHDYLKLIWPEFPVTVTEGSILLQNI